MDLKNASDIELMRLTRDGDRQAFAEIIRRYQRPLVNFFRRMGARNHETEDLVQDAFLRVFGYRERWQPKGKFTNFLYVLARHAWADLARKGARAPETNEIALSSLTIEGDAGRADAQMDIHVALSTLSEKLRIVVVLNVFQGLKYQEIAEVLDIPLGTVKSRMHLALGQLREFFDAEPAE